MLCFSFLLSLFTWFYQFTSCYVTGLSHLRFVLAVSQQSHVTNTHTLMNSHRARFTLLVFFFHDTDFPYKFQWLIFHSFALAIMSTALLMSLFSWAVFFVLMSVDIESRAHSAQHNYTSNDRMIFKENTEKNIIK